MQDNSLYVVGIDIGTTTVRCVVGHIDETTGTPTIVGVGQAPTSGMRKGVVSNLHGPAKAIDEALGEAERMSGYEIDGASISINGAHILSTQTDGMIAVGSTDHEVSPDDLHRLEEVATIGKVPANRQILEVVPHDYRLDGQDNIKDPVGMTGTRLEINANVVSALAPHLTNLQKTAEMAKVATHTIMPSVLAGAHTVLEELQRENGVAIIDLGGATTSIAVFEEGDLQHVAVIPVGGNNITNDLAIGLKTDPGVAEIVKISHAVASVRGDHEGITVKHEGVMHTFSSADMDDIVEARLEEIFELVHKELRRIGKAGQLPSGIVLVGGSANIKGIAEYARTQLGLAVRVGIPKGYGGVAEHVDKPQFATVIGLMQLDAENGQSQHGASTKKKSKPSSQQAAGFIKKFFDRLKV